MRDVQSKLGRQSRPKRAKPNQVDIYTSHKFEHLCNGVERTNEVARTKVRIELIPHLVRSHPRPHIEEPTLVPQIPQIKSSSGDNDVEKHRNGDKIYQFSGSNPKFQMIAKTVKKTTS
jgi:hypothetical protein